MMLLNPSLSSMQSHGLSIHNIYGSEVTRQIGAGSVRCPVGVQYVKGALGMMMTWGLCTHTGTLYTVRQ